MLPFWTKHWIIFCSLSLLFYQHRLQPRAVLPPHLLARLLQHGTLLLLFSNHACKPKFHSRFWAHSICSLMEGPAAITTSRSLQFTTLSRALTPLSKLNEDMQLVKWSIQTLHILFHCFIKTLANPQTLWADLTKLTSLWHEPQVLHSSSNLDFPFCLSEGLDVWLACC